MERDLKIGTFSVKIEERVKYIDCVNSYKSQYGTVGVFIPFLEYLTELYPFTALK